MLDYLRLTTGKSQNFNPETWAKIYLDGIKDGFTGEITNGIMGYNQGRITENGALYWHDTEDIMGVCYQISGHNLNKMFTDGQDENELLKHFASKNCRFARIDYAFDVLENPEATPLSFFEHIQNKEVNTGARKNMLINGKNPRNEKRNNADTVYLGSRQSETFLRVYDKAKELKLTEFDWTRIELELKGKRANAIGNAVSDNTTIQIIAASHIKRMGNFSLDWFNQALLSEQFCYVGLPSKDAGNPQEYFDSFIIKWFKKNAYRLRKDQLKTVMDLCEGIYYNGK